MTPGFNQQVCQRMDDTGMDGYAVLAEMRWQIKRAFVSISKWAQDLTRTFDQLNQTYRRMVISSGRRTGRSAYAERIDRMHTEFQGGQLVDTTWATYPRQPSENTREALLEARRHRNTGPHVDLVQNRHRPRSHE